MKSPVPYSIAEVFPGDKTSYILSAEDTHVATCYENPEADAVFIVTACNAHVALVKALDNLEALVQRIEIGSMCGEPVSHLLGRSMFVVNARGAVEEARKVLS